MDDNNLLPVAYVAYPFSEAQLAELGDLGLTVVQGPDEGSLPPAAFEAEILVCNNLLSSHPPEQFPKLKFVQFTSAGLDRAPVARLTDLGVDYENAAGVFAAPMVEWALLQILRFYKQAAFFCDRQQEGVWEKRRDLLEISGKTAVIVGYGSVGAALGGVLETLGARIVAVSRSPKSMSPPSESVPLDRLEEALEQADIVVVSIAQTPETRRLINRDALSHIPEGAVFLNLARGGVVDSGALIEGVQAGRFRGVALDVFDEEPLPEDHAIWSLSDVVVTPHVSFQGDGNSGRMHSVTLQNISRVVRDHGFETRDSRRTS